MRVLRRGSIRGLTIVGAYAALLTASGAAAADTPTVFGPTYPLAGYNDSAHQTHGGSTCVQTGSLGSSLTWTFGASSATTAPTGSPSTACDGSAGVAPPPFDTTRFQDLYWGLDPAHSDTSASCSGPQCTINAGWTSGPLTYDPAAPASDPPHGVVVYKGTSDPSIHLTLTFKTAGATPVPVAVTSATTIGNFNSGVSGSAIGQVVHVTPTLANFQVTMAWDRPVVPGNCDCHVQTDITGGFYWVDRPPTGDFTFATPVNHQPVGLTAGTLSDPDGTAASYSWDLNGDGTYGDDPNTPNPSTAALGLGDHTVGLEIVDNDGTKTDVTHTITVTNAPPHGDFTVPTVKNHQPATFKATGISDPDQDPGGAAPTYTWDLNGDGTYGDSPNSDAAGTFGPGQHTVGLEITDSEGGVRDVTHTFTITNAKPTADFSCSPSALVAGQSTACTATASDPDAAPGDPALQEAWSAAGANQTGGTATFTLPVGSDTVTFTVTDRDGATTTVSHIVTVAPASPPPMHAGVSVAGGQKLKAAMKNGIQATFTGNEAMTSSLAVTLPAKQAKKLHLTGKLWTGAPRLRSAGSAKFVIKLTKKAEHKLGKLKKVSFVLAGTAKNAAGESAAITMKFVLKK